MSVCQDSIFFCLVLIILINGDRGHSSNLWWNKVNFFLSSNDHLESVSRHTYSNKSFKENFSWKSLEVVFTSTLRVQWGARNIPPEFQLQFICRSSFRQERKRKEVKILQKWQMINPSKSYTSPLKISSLFKIKEKEIYKSRLVEVG